MKKQFNYYETRWPYYTLCIYHDGELVGKKKVDEHQLREEIDYLETNGYTYGYDKEDVEIEHRRYEHMLKNIINKK